MYKGPVAYISSKQSRTVKSKTLDNKHIYTTAHADIDDTNRYVTQCIHRTSNTHTHELKIEVSQVSGT